MDIRFVHRKLNNTDIYWVNNRNHYSQKFEAAFRVDGKLAEIWYPESGKMERVSYKMENGLTKVPLQMTAEDAFFVVFKNKTDIEEYNIPQKIEKQLATLDEIWTVDFEPNRGAPEQITIDSLISWTTHSNLGVKYFSGTANYKKTLNINEDWLKKEAELWLDLGDVKNLAEVFVNGKYLGTLWNKTLFCKN